VACAARRDAQARFGLRQHAEAIMDVYDGLLARAGARSLDPADRAGARLPHPERASDPQESVGASR
jgi:hypothetical protein